MPLLFLSAHSCDDDYYGDSDDDDDDDGDDGDADADAGDDVNVDDEEDEEDGKVEWPREQRKKICINAFAQSTVHP